MIFADVFRGLIQGGEAVIDAAIDKVFDAAQSAANLIPLPRTKAAALKLIADGRVNLRKAIDTAADDTGDLVAAAIDDATTLFANAAQTVDTSEKLEPIILGAIGQLQTLLGQHHAGVSPVSPPPA